MKNCFQNQLPRCMICFATQEIRLINAGIVIGVENVLPKPLSWRCTNFATVLGRSHFYKKNCEFCEKLFPKPTSQMTHMFYSHRRKDLQTQDCDICGKYFTKTTVTMMHKFHHIEAKPSLEGELRVLWKIVPKTNLPDELHVYFKHRRNAVIVISVENVYKTAVLKTHKYSHSGARPFLEGKLWVLWVNVFYTNIPDESHVNSHRRKALQTQKCDIYGKYISKPLAWRCANIATVGRRHF